SSWIKTDLGQHGDKPMIRKKYSAKMFGGKDGVSVLAVVSDNDKGMVWICPNIVDNKNIWMKKDFKIDLPEGKKTGQN
ncbi:MAG: hypothetical protein ABIA66_01835, partial [Candidatus Omnitrophota bacterium]